MYIYVLRSAVAVVVSAHVASLGSGGANGRGSSCERDFDDDSQGEAASSSMYDMISHTQSSD